MARARLVKDRRIAIAPGTRRVVVFDTTTGAGAECCCGGGTVSACCSTKGNTFCTIPHIGAPLIKCGRRVDIAITGSMFHKIERKASSVSPIYTEYQNTATGNLGAFWRLTDNTGDNPNCAETIGKVATSSRSATGFRGDAGGQTVSWSLNKNDTTFMTGLPTLSRGWSRSIQQGGPADPWNNIYAACSWSAFALDHNLNSGQAPPGAAVVLFDPAPIKDTGGSETIGFDATLGIGMAESIFPNTMYGSECSGSRYELKNPGFLTERESSLSWSSSATQTGGSFSVQLSVRTGRLVGNPGTITYETFDFSGTWVLTRTLCAGDSDSSGRSWPGCDSFVRSWLAGDAIADVNGDGVVDGDDYDAVMRAHPECVSTIDELTRARVVQIRNVRRPAVAGAVKPGDLLGLGG